MRKTKKTSFQEVRAVHRDCELAEDYTELIADLLKTAGKARVCDLAAKMGVSHVSVLKAVKRLVQKGYLLKGTDIGLTEKGQALARFAKRRHDILAEFLAKLGVPPEIAAVDVEGMEHHVSRATLEAIEAHLPGIRCCESSPPAIPVKE